MITSNGKYLMLLFVVVTGMSFAHLCSAADAAEYCSPSGLPPIGEHVTPQKADPAFSAIKAIDDERLLLALSVVIGSGDEKTFIQSCKIPAYGNDVEGANRKAIQWAKDVLAGRLLFPVPAELLMFGYNPENSRIMTAAIFAEEKTLIIKGKAPTFGELPPVHLNQIRLRNINQFSSFAIPSEDSREFLNWVRDAAEDWRRDGVRELIGQRFERRFLGLTFWVRFDRRTAHRTHGDVYLDDVYYMIDADVVTYSIEIETGDPMKRWAAPSVVQQRFAPLLVAQPYRWTGDEERLSAQLAGRSFYSSKRGFHFFPNHVVRLVEAPLSSDPAVQKYALNSAPERKWFLVNGKILMPPSDLESHFSINPDNYSFPFEIEDGGIRLNSILYREVH